MEISFEIWVEQLHARRLLSESGGHLGGDVGRRPGSVCAESLTMLLHCLPALTPPALQTPSDRRRPGCGFLGLLRSSPRASPKQFSQMRAVRDAGPDSRLELDHSPPLPFYYHAALLLGLIF